MEFCNLIFRFVYKVKIIKENTDGESESDIEIDIENDESDVTIKPPPTQKPQQQIHNNNKPLQSKTETSVPDEQTFNLSEYDENVKSQLTSLEKPIEELILDPNSISELEKAVHSDFFEGRTAKTPSRYLKVSELFFCLQDCNVSFFRFAIIL